MARQDLAVSAASSEQKLEVVADAIGAIAGSLDLDETLQAVVEAARKITGARYAALGVLGGDRRIIRFITSGMTAEEVEHIGAFPIGRGILGVLIDEQRPVRLRDLGADPRSSGFPPNHPPMRSFIGVPLRAHGRIFGNLYLTESPSGEFGEDDEKLLVLLAAHAGIAVDHAEAFAEAQAQAEEARRAARARTAIAGVATTILRERDVGQVLAALADEARDLVQARLVGIGMPDEATGSIRFPVAVGEGADQLRGREERIDGLISGAVLQAGVPMRFAAGDADQLRTSELYPVVASTSQLVVPVTGEGEPIAVIVAVDSQRPDGAFTADDQELLEALASLGAVAFQTARAFRRERVRGEAVAQLQRAEAEAALRREALGRVVETQERERRRIAQDLHDRTAGALASVRLALKRLERDAEPEQAERLREASADISAAIDDLRDLIADLRPKVLDDYGLEPALDRLAVAFRRRTGVDVRFSSTGELSALSPDLATATYRIVQEALVNVARHADARAVELSASAQPDALSVTVADDGRGVAVGSLEGYGLAGMQERASLVGGRVEIDRAPGGGTVVRFEAPL